MRRVHENFKMVLSGSKSKCIRVLGKTLLLLTLFFHFLSCEKLEGPGGTGSISGTITEYIYNDGLSLLIDQKPAVDEEVFVLYGDDELVGDRTITSNAGKFSFKYLHPGDYTIYFMSADSTEITDEDRENIFELNVGRGQQIDLGNLVKLSILDYDDGGAVIKGVVSLINYINESKWPNLVIKDISFAQEHEIYLTYDNHTFYDERIRTQFDGTFEFRNLIPGDYLIYLYSEDVTGGTQDVTIKHTVAITEMDQVVDLGEITIEQH